MNIRHQFQNELNTFDENFKAVDIANEILDYNLGSGHIY